MKTFFLAIVSVLIAADGFTQATNVFNTTGDAGLGTLTPAALSYGVSPHLQISDRTSLFQLGGNTGSYMSNNLYYSSGWKYHQNGAGSYIIQGQGTIGFTYAAANSSGAGASANPNYSMYVDESGKVGIGTTATTNGKMTISGTDINLLRLESEAGGGESIMRLRSKTTGGSYLHADISTYAEGGYMGFKIPYNNDAGVGYQMIINTSGNVGIGTNSPSEKLSVNGNISAKKIIVTQTGWSDYVFDSSYQLKSLSELAEFIKRNKHLPDIPSAKEVEEKGINVGDSEAILLKKIEELTLYLMIQQKQIDELREQIHRK